MLEFGIARVSPGFRMVERKRLNRFRHAIVPIETAIASLAEPFRDAASAAKQISRSRTILIVATVSQEPNALCVIVNVTALSGNRDQTVTLGLGDHPFITHSSVVLYGDARIVYSRRLEADLHSCVAERREPCSEKLLKLVQGGIEHSPFTPKKVVGFCRSQWRQ